MQNFYEGKMFIKHTKFERKLILKISQFATWELQDYGEQFTLEAPHPMKTFIWRKDMVTERKNLLPQVIRFQK